MAIAAPATAAGDNAPEKSFQQLDKYRNGTLSKLEVAGLPALNTNFAAADASGDLQLSREEFDALHGKPIPGKDQQARQDRQRMK